jgi:hypothetical protein
MNLALPVFVIALVSANVEAGEPAIAKCPLSALVSSIQNMPQATNGPVLTEDNLDAFRTVSLYEPAGATDQFLYAALIDRTNEQAWVYQYGGYRGVSSWYGPIEIDVSLAEKCSPAKAIIPVTLSSSHGRVAQPSIPTDLSRKLRQSSEFKYLATAPA